MLMNLHHIIVFKRPLNPNPHLQKKCQVSFGYRKVGNKSILKYNLPAHRAQAHFDPRVQEISDGTLYLGILQSKSEQYITSEKNTNDSSI